MGNPQRSFSALFTAAQEHDEYWTERASLRFTEELTRWMKQQGLSRKDLAEKIGSSQAYITKILKGNVNFTLASMVKLTRALGAELRIELDPRKSATEEAIDSTDLEDTGEDRREPRRRLA
ncbi:MAG TPA: helix-turn-helix transcriptional regulator [Thermoanaerobaculia bacterium]|nr:helix-turn-helix transcriptional regulator [Thermoanaerobaculia bacterium]